MCILGNKTLWSQHCFLGVRRGDCSQAAGSADAHFFNPHRWCWDCHCLRLPLSAAEWHLQQPMSAQFRSVSTTRRLNSPFRSVSCMHSSLMLRCRTFPGPRARTYPPLLSHKMSRCKAKSSWQRSWRDWMPKAAALTIPQNSLSPLLNATTVCLATLQSSKCLPSRAVVHDTTFASPCLSSPVGVRQEFQ